MKFLVTGGAGFIGSNIVRELIKQNHEVIVIDNLLTGKLENLKDILKKIKFVKGDIIDLNLLKKEFKDVDYVLHQAALPSVPHSVEDPITSNQNNINGTLNVLIAARDCGVKRVIYAASSSVYGNAKELPKNEEMNSNPLSPYAITKFCGELYCKVFYDLYGLETVVLRYFNVFGPRQDPNSQYAAVIPRFINLMLKNKRPTIFGDGLQTRDFTYVQNIVEANLLACKAKNVAGKIFNIACEKRISLNQLVEIINKVLKTNIKSIHDKERKGDVKHSLADITKAKKILGYKVNYDFEYGLRKTIEWFRSKK